MHSITKSETSLSILWKYDKGDDVSLEDAEELQNILGTDCFSYTEKK